MTTANTTLLQDNSTDTNFRAWGSWISGCFSKFGWLQSSDTGQINWSTVTHPTTTSASQGFEIWKTNDGVGTQYYLKVEYGSGSLVSTSPSLFLTLGTGSNGSGTLTGQLSTRTQIATNNSTTTQYLSIASGASGRFMVEMFVQNTAGGIGFQLERIKDTTGADATTGMVILLHGSATKFHQTIPASGTIWSQDAFIPVAWTRNTSMTASLNTGMQGIYPTTQTTYPSMMGLIGYETGDIPTGSVFGVLRKNGISTTYFATGIAWISSSLLGAVIYQ